MYTPSSDLMQGFNSQFTPQSAIFNRQYRPYEEYLTTAADNLPDIYAQNYQRALQARQEKLALEQWNTQQQQARQGQLIELGNLGLQGAGAIGFRNIGRGINGAINWGTDRFTPASYYSNPNIPMPDVTRTLPTSFNSMTPAMNLNSAGLARWTTSEGTQGTSPVFAPEPSWSLTEPALRANPAGASGLIHEFNTNIDSGMRYNTTPEYGSEYYKTAGASTPSALGQGFNAGISGFGGGRTALGLVSAIGGKPNAENRAVIGGLGGALTTGIQSALKGGFSPYSMAISGITGALGTGLKSKNARRVADYAGYGATVGSFVPGVGSLIGAGIGGLVGAAKKWFKW